jgi:hypothetical protein
MSGNDREAAMIRLFTAITIIMAMTPAAAYALECGSTANRAGCTTANGAVGYNRNTGAIHRTQPNQVTPGEHIEGQRGNSATKAAEPGCAYVNGRRVCN